MKIIGRIIMAAVAIICLAVNIPVLIAGIQAIKEAGWTLETVFSNVQIVLSLVVPVYYILFGR